MKAIFNDKIINSSSFSLEIGDRAFLYGDSLFETVKWIDGRVPLLKFHVERLKKGIGIMGFSEPHGLTENILGSKLTHLCQLNGISDGHARIRIKVWRKQGGTYTPTSDRSNLLITAVAYEPESGSIEKTDFCEKVVNYFTPWSECKTGSALSYIMAGLEAREKGLDDIILCDNHGHVSELLHSNIWWIKSGVFFTPSLSTGCIAGVMRAYMMQKMAALGFKPMVGEYRRDHLLEADHVLSTNAMGIRPVTRIGTFIFQAYPGIHQFLP